MYPKNLKLFNSHLKSQNHILDLRELLHEKNEIKYIFLKQTIRSQKPHDDIFKFCN